MAANKYTGTQTEKNLQEAFTGESQARNKYTYFASEFGHWAAANVAVADEKHFRHVKIFPYIVSS